MITTVTLNPAIDKIIEINNMNLGNVHRASKLIKTLGGKSINVSRILTGLNIKNEALCFAGEENLSEVRTFAARDDINLFVKVIEGTTRTNVKIIEPDEDYRTTDINEKGFVVSKEALESMLKIIYEKAKLSNYVVLSGSLPEGVPIDVYRTITRKIDNKVVLDADGEILMEGLKGSPYIIKPNIFELEAALNTKLTSIEEIVKACRDLIKEYNISYILVSMGEKGSILVSNTIAYKADIIPVKVLSTVGAGDSMLAGFIYGLETYKDLDEKKCLEKALACGVASSSIAISTQNHIAFSKEILEDYAKKVLIQIVG